MIAPETHNFTQKVFPVVLPNGSVGFWEPITSASAANIFGSIKTTLETQEVMAEDHGKIKTALKI